MPVHVANSITDQSLARAALLAGVCLALTAPAAAHDPHSVAVARGGMVASDSPDASRIGADVLQSGGNAFDAAVATSLALTVARPQSTGLGGGGFLLAYVAKEDRFVVLDFRETAPQSATAARYERILADSGGGPSPTVYGGHAVGVPGLPAGLAEINRRFGTRLFAELAAPAIALAERGIEVDEPLRRARREALEYFERYPEFGGRFAAFRQALLREPSDPDAPQRLVRPDLARTLRALAEHGPESFYDGAIAEAIIAAVRADGGEMTFDDLKAYRVEEREPLTGYYGEHRIVTMPPPSSGGAALIQTLNIVQAASLRSDLEPSMTAPHVLAEAFKHAFADRARWFGDPAFCDIPLGRLLSPQYAAQLARRIDRTTTHAPEHYGTPVPVIDDSGTSHFCVADRFGNLVAMTETINGVYGSYVLVEPYGVLLNNELDDFLTAPGRANLFGLVQGEANRIGPGKRPLSSMTPTIVLRDDKPLLIVGGAGGPRIITGVTQVILNTLNGSTLHDALSSPRLHHQWLPDEVFFDREPPRRLRAKLERFSHRISDQRRTSRVNAIQFLAGGEMVGASDPDRGGRPVGVD